MSNRFDDLFAEADNAFSGQYKDQLNELLGLSKSELDSLTPDTKGMSVYSKLIKVVEQASKDNLAQADLINNIKSLGDLAVKIAKKVPALAAIL
tara:strand:+ start:121147 stop:121428 length:282 start_codon:yes stop_codon:yes gene_type:complete